ncbi:hypothetical protein C7B82_18365 [Stenomitos frigidus ULC18]|uniref:RSAM-associated Gly-rich repeat protein n=2 Tax=Stenomitos TaxID=1844270 RepID=A0A2T1E250_9CYAN|nr:hypothetical protein C7B82_18365 [Stenomitos frigidus ULC18]
MAAAIGLLPIIAVSLLPQVASAQAALRAATVSPWTIADRYDNDDRRDHDDHRDGWRNRNIDYQRANDRRDNDRWNNNRRDQQRRVWIPGHWESGFLGIGRKWVEGHYENR